MSEPSTRHVVVIGACAIGVISAIELLRDGHRVTIIEPGTAGHDRLFPRLARYVKALDQMFSTWGNSRRL